MTDKTTLNQPDEHHAAADQDSATEPATSAAANARAGGTVTNSETASEPKRPLITAIEIENFKGIGAPVRIDLRPITLLFGRNSAGKSTILQALCYAHEVLSHRNVDAHRTELGGEQIDLGGCRNFVHQHSRRRTVRLRFELNLESRRVPEPLMERMKHSDYVAPETASEFQDWVDANDPVELAESAWVELAIKANPSGKGPMLYSLEVGINEKLFGRIRQNDKSNPTGMILDFNWMHPQFEGLRGDVAAPLRFEAAAVHETADGQLDEWQIHQTETYGGLKFPVPDWDDLLYLNDETLDKNENIDVGGLGSTSYPKFQALVTGALVGVGRTLRDELARLRYIGPLRELSQRTGGPSDPHQRGHWSDGSAAWDLLQHRDQIADLYGGDLLRGVNDWLAGEERLDTGYKLRRRSTVMLRADVAPVSQIQRHEQRFARYRNRDGTVDFDRFVRDKIPMFIRYGHRPEQAETIIRKVFEYELVGIVDQLEKGRPPSDVKALVRAIAKAETRTTIELVTAKKGLPMRTSDIGVGVSQILPVVVAALDPDRPEITAIEQPELHVHPRMQVELGDLFVAALDRPISGIDALTDQSRQPGGIFLIETHSEHLILRLLRRIEETHSGELPEGKPALKPDQVSVVFLEQADGEVRATRLRIDETGEFIDRWPQGFFNERSAELFY